MRDLDLKGLRALGRAFSSDHPLLTCHGIWLLFDDAGHRMAPTHATKAGIRYRYYVSRPCLHGEAKTAKVGSVTRVPAADIEDAIQVTDV